MKVKYIMDFNLNGLYDLLNSVDYHNNRLDIAKILNFNPDYVSTLLNILIREGFVERLCLFGFKRYRFLLTPKGKILRGLLFDLKNKRGDFE